MLTLANKARAILKEALRELEDLDELVIEMAVTDEFGKVSMLVMNTGELIAARENENA